MGQEYSLIFASINAVAPADAGQAPMRHEHPLIRSLLLFFGGQGEGYGVVFEVAFVGAIAEGFVLGKATTADGNDLASA